MTNITAKQRLRYWFDNTMSKGPIALIGWLFVLSAVMIFFIALVVRISGIQEEWTFWQAVWASLMRTLDAGTMGGDQGNVPFLLAMLAVTLGGIFIVSLLIGVLTSGIEGKLEELQKGRSLVVETGHTVILGWSPQVFSIVSELVTANANQRHPCIAILAPKDKMEMEGEIRDKVGSTGRTRVVCRTGSPIDLNDLEIVSPHTARAIIILAPETGDADSHTIKTILALTNNPNRHPDPYHIVAEIRDSKNMEVARLVGREEAQLVLVSDLIARITAQTCRQSGLSLVYTELLDFGGDEIYFKEEPGLIGKTYGEALLAYADSTAIGVRRRDGAVQLNPPMEYCLEAGDQVIAISEDDDTIRLSGLTEYPIEAEAILLASSNGAAPERTLILGWNRNAPRIIGELHNYVASGSVVTIVADLGAEEMAAICQCGELENQTVTFQQGDPTDRKLLDKLNIPAYDHVITLGDADASDPQVADARTLVTLLHLRDISDRLQHPFSIVSEMLDLRNRALAEVTRADDFIVSDKLVSLMLSQISENKELSAVFQDLFDPEGSELYLKPAGEYVKPGRPVNYYTVVEAARRRGETAIGYRLRPEASNPEKAYGVRVNPEKSLALTFLPGDRIIVLAEE
jgi:voltage-gated potassium channel Kch